MDLGLGLVEFLDLLKFIVPPHMFKRMSEKSRFPSVHLQAYDSSQN